MGLWVEAETENDQVTKALDQIDDRTTSLVLDNILVDCSDFAGYFGYLKHIGRNGNRVAHNIAKSSNFSYPCVNVSDFPSSVIRLAYSE